VYRSKSISQAYKPTRSEHNAICCRCFVYMHSVDIPNRIYPITRVCQSSVIPSYSFVCPHMLLEITFHHLTSRCVPLGDVWNSTSHIVEVMNRKTYLAPRLVNMQMNLQWLSQQVTVNASVH
jgi:hypothetical protein